MSFTNGMPSIGWSRCMPIRNVTPWMLSDRTIRESQHGQPVARISNVSLRQLCTTKTPSLAQRFYSVPSCQPVGRPFVLSSLDAAAESSNSSAYFPQLSIHSLYRACQSNALHGYQRLPTNCRKNRRVKPNGTTPIFTSIGAGHRLACIGKWLQQVHRGRGRRR